MTTSYTSSGEVTPPSVRLFEAVVRVGSRLAAIRSLRRLLAESVDLICETFNLETVVICLLDEGRQHIKLEAAYGRDGRELAEHSAWQALDAVSAIGRALQQRQAVRDWVAIEGLHSQADASLVLPLTFEEDLGALILYGSSNDFTPDRSRAFQLLSTHLAVLLHNARLYIRDASVLASAERRAKLLEAATIVERDVASILDVDVLLGRIVDTICMVYGFYYAAVFMVDTKMKRWAVLRAGYGEAGRKMLESGHLLPVDDNSMVGWCINHKQARIALDVGQDAVRFNNPLLPDTRSEMALPLVMGDDVIGAISVQSTQESAFDEKDVTTLQILAEQLAIVINNAQLMQDLRETSRELLRTKTFEAIATATGEAIHWVGNKAAPIPACVARIQEDLGRLIYMADMLLAQSPDELRQHAFAQIIADAAVTLDEQLPAGRTLMADLQHLPLKKMQRLLNMDSILEDLGIIRLSAETILDIKENMIGPARESHRHRLRLDELLKGTLTSMAISSQVEVEQRYAPDLPYVLADSRQLESVFNNLIKNAVEAMEGRPQQRLTIDVARSSQGNRVNVRISDTGCGIAKADLDRIWISFYTTKGNKGGTGLGLSSCLQIVSQMEGKIEVESEINVGTTFIVSLPALEA